jgi:hypothetical protein
MHVDDPSGHPSWRTHDSVLHKTWIPRLQHKVSVSDMSAIEPPSRSKKASRSAKQQEECGKQQECRKKAT